MVEHDRRQATAAGVLLKWYIIVVRFGAITSTTGRSGAVVCRRWCGCLVALVVCAASDKLQTIGHYLGDIGLHAVLVIAARLYAALDQCFATFGQIVPRYFCCTSKHDHAVPLCSVDPFVALFLAVVGRNV